MKDTSKKLSGQEGFESYYREIYGKRWEDIKKSFYTENQSVKFQINDNLKPYFLDFASVYAAACLPLDNAEKIADLCAAPGGKTLILALRMKKEANLSSNERSGERKHRLQTVVSECLPEDIQKRIIVSCSDAATWCKRQTECFDSILLDAPCSSERHVFLDPKYLNSWSPSRIKTVSMEQWALLSSAYRLLKPEGYLLYSTCAISPEENDLMIEKLFKKFNKNNDAFEIIEAKPDFSSLEKCLPLKNLEAENTKYGKEIFPDKMEGAGPLYFCLIKKKKSVLI